MVYVFVPTERPLTAWLPGFAELDNPGPLTLVVKGGVPEEDHDIVEEPG
jgi:hypothetical protein